MLYQDTRKLNNNKIKQFYMKKLWLVVMDFVSIG